MEFFAFIHAEKMPEFWVDYDRGTLTLDEVVRILSREKACDERVTARFIRDAIDRQEEIVETRALVGDLKRVGYKLYVLSNMSRSSSTSCARCRFTAVSTGRSSPAKSRS